MGKRVSADVTQKRREMVSTLRRHGMTLDEITSHLGAPYIRNKDKALIDNPAYFPNPKTGKPFDRSVISRDLAKLREEANARATQNADEIRADLLDRSEELYRIAMKQKSVSKALRVLTFVAKLTGANKPEQKELRWDDKQLESMQTAKQSLRDKLAQVGLQTVGVEDE